MHTFPIPDNIIKVLSALEAAGYEAYTVGGCVRDMCRGVLPHDYDVTTSALPEETKACFEGCRVIETGIKHGTVTVLSDGEPVEITTYRTDGEYADNRHPVAVSFTPSLSEDLSRRDFTVNAMAYSPTRGLVDVFGGRRDIDARVIRCVGEPDKRFGEDGLRILRALRFASCLDYTIDADTSASIEKNAHLLENISAERIYSELCKLVTGKGAHRIIAEYPCVIGKILPSLTDARYADAVRAVGESESDLILRLALLVGSKEGAMSDMQALKSDGATRRSVASVAEMAGVRLSDRVSLRRALRGCTADNLRRAIKMQKITAKIDETEEKRLLSLLEDAKNDPVTPASLAIGGEDVKRLTGASGRAIGDALERMLELVITDAVPNERAALEAELKQM